MPPNPAPTQQILGRITLSDMELTSDEPLNLGCKFNWQVGDRLYVGVMPVSVDDNGVYTCKVDWIDHIHYQT